MLAPIPDYLNEIPDEIVEEEIDEAYVKRPHPRVANIEEIEGGMIRFQLLCDDGLEKDVIAQAAKLSKRLAKWGQAMTVTGAEDVMSPSWLDKTKMIRRVLLTIETPSMSGKKARLIGSFDRAEDGEQVYRYAFHGHTEADLEPYLSRWSECDHCKTNRNRNSTFLCETEAGERVLIGRQCSMDYLGLDPADILAREAVFRSYVTPDSEDGEYTGPRYAKFMNTEFLVHTAYRVAKRYGGYSKAIRDEFLGDIDALYGAKDYGKSTHNRDIRAWYAKAPAPEPLDLQALADYVYAQRGPFWMDVRIALEMQNIKIKRRNMVVAGVGLFVGQAAKVKAPVAETPKMKLLPGAPEERVEFIGTVITTRPYESRFGPKCAITIHTDNGENCVHFSAKEHNPAAGTRYSIKAIIDKQDEAKGQTVLTRAVYKELVY